MKKEEGIGVWKADPRPHLRRNGEGSPMVCHTPRTNGPGVDYVLETKQVIHGGGLDTGFWMNHVALDGVPVQVQMSSCCVFKLGLSPLNVAFSRLLEKPHFLTLVITLTLFRDSAQPFIHLRTCSFQGVP